MAMLEVKLVPALTDNYIALIRDEKSGSVAIVDPGEADQVEWCLKKLGWKTPSLIFNTHHHGDHVGANQTLQEKYRCGLVASVVDEKRVPGTVTRAVRGGDTVALGESIATVIDIPGHTLGHVAFWFEKEKIVFVGDTLFGLGCGRLFEGTAAQLFHSLNRLAELPDDTLVYCGHEYTLANARFAEQVEPNLASLKARVAAVEALRAKGLSSVPFTLGDDKQSNPFLRVKSVEAFAELRRKKDHF